MGDVFSGIAVGIMHIPQGLAYGVLGNLPPIVGIYMGFFPVLVYCIFGTSRHVSIGTFAIVCLMTGKTVLVYSSAEGYTPIQVATTVTFTVSAIQLIMYLFRLGIITTLLSETLVNAFTCASAFHVVTTQIGDLLGLTLPRRNGLFRILYTFYDIGASISQVNVPTILISLICIAIIAINNEIVKPILARRTKIPFPIELVAILTSTAISHSMSFNNNYSVNVVGTMPTRLPRPDLPSFSLIPLVIIDSFIITIVSYTVTMSLALALAQKHKYEVNSNQELLALSCSNFFGSFVSCMPVTASLSRTMVQDSVGGATQLASVVSCFMLLLVLLWIGPLLEHLPTCVLGSVIVVSLKPMIFQLLSLNKYWSLSKWDGFVWTVTFFTTVLVDIKYGLLAGFTVSLVSIFVQNQKCYTCLLGVVPNTELYLDVKLYKRAQEMSGIKIFRYTGPLNFASKDVFRKTLFRKTGFDPLSLCIKTKTNSKDNICWCVILDFSALSYVDPSGIKTLKLLLEDYRRVDINMYICLNSSPIFEQFKKCQKHDNTNDEFVIFPTVHDAVLYCQSAAGIIIT